LIVKQATIYVGGIGMDAVDAALAISRAVVLFVDEEPRYIKNIKVCVFDLNLLDLFRLIITPGIGEQKSNKITL